TNVDLYISDLTAHDPAASALRVEGVGAGTTSRVVSYGDNVARDTATGSDVPLVEVLNQGHALVYDGWDECCSPRKVYLTSQHDGTLTYWGYLFANHETFDYPWVGVDGFHGMLSLLGIAMTDKPIPVVIGAEAADTDVLILQAGSYVTNPAFERLSS